MTEFVGQIVGSTGHWVATGGQNVLKDGQIVFVVGHSVVTAGH